MNADRQMLALDETDAAIILKQDGTCEVSLPTLKNQLLPENVIMGAALAYALQNQKLCDLIQENFKRQCEKLERDCG